MTAHNLTTGIAGHVLPSFAHFDDAVDVKPLIDAGSQSDVEIKKENRRTKHVRLLLLQNA